MTTKSGMGVTTPLFFFLPLSKAPRRKEHITKTNYSMA